LAELEETQIMRRALVFLGLLGLAAGCPQNGESPSDAAVAAGADASKHALDAAALARADASMPFNPDAAVIAGADASGPSHEDAAAIAGADASIPVVADAGTTPEPDASAPPKADAGSGASDGGATTTLRVHYPAGAHTVTIRGSSAPLSWTQGTPTSAGADDTFSFSWPGLAAPAEWKPLLDDTTWARGPNYHIAPGQTIDVFPHFTTINGQVVTLIADFHSTVMANDRAIYAYLPPSYAENTDATYPVVYLHDGQNLWAALPQIAFAGTWNVDTAFDTAASVGACSSGGLTGWGAQPLGSAPTTCNGDGDCASGSCRTFPEAILIGVANDANRIYEYTPTTDPGTPGGGGGDLYIQMLVTELKPKIDGMLRTRPASSSTALVGSSLGGLISAYAGLRHPEVWGLIGELSPSTWWNNDVIVGDVATTLPKPDRPLIVYVDSGQGDADDESDTDLLASKYLSLGYVDGVDFRHVIQPGAQHGETYWAERFPGAMQLLLGER
jgi:predicted alpha/beta superfamily hydrolase